MMDAKDRLRQYLHHERLTAVDFEKRCGFGNGYVHNFTGKPSKRTLEAISRAYPNLSLSWLIEGSGDMLQCVKQRDSGMSMGELEKKIREVEERLAKIEGKI